MDMLACPKCTNKNFFMRPRGAQMGLYCDACGAWIKWVGKKDINSFKNRGVKIIAPDVPVTFRSMPVINRKPSNDQMGIEDVPFQSNSMESSGQMGFESESPFGSPPEVKMENLGINGRNSEEWIEKEVERRVSERLRSVEIKGKESIGENVESGYCPYCDGETLKNESGNKISVVILGGVMTVTDIDGVNIYGLYKLKRCPFCGKVF